MRIRREDRITSYNVCYTKLLRRDVRSTIPSVEDAVSIARIRAVPSMCLPRRGFLGRMCEEGHPFQPKAQGLPVDSRDDLPGHERVGSKRGGQRPGGERLFAKGEVV